MKLEQNRGAREAKKERLPHWLFCLPMSACVERSTRTQSRCSRFAPTAENPYDERGHFLIRLLPSCGMASWRRNLRCIFYPCLSGQIAGLTLISVSTSTNRSQPPC